MRVRETVMAMRIEMKARIRGRVKDARPRKQCEVGTRDGEMVMLGT